MNTRRNFIKQSGIMCAGLAISPGSFVQKPAQLGIQLYSLREEIAKDVKAVIPKIAAAGFDDVETYGYSNKAFFGLSPKNFRELLEQNKLKSTSGHYGGLDNFLFANGKEDDVKLLIDAVKAMGQQYLIVPSLGYSKEKTLDDYKRAANSFNKAGMLCNKSGITMGFHNHSEEFKKQEGGVSGYDILLKETDPRLVVMEMDIYWVVRAGQDPVSMFQKNPGRFPLWHVKDMDRNNKDHNTEIGNGTIDFKKIMGKAKLAGLKRIFLEQENFDMDPYESISKSSKYIRQELLK